MQPTNSLKKEGSSPAGLFYANILAATNPESFERRVVSSHLRIVWRHFKEDWSEETSW